MNVRKADARFRRFVFGLFAAAVCVGGLLVALFDRYQAPLANWIVAGRASGRIELVFFGFAVLLVAPLLAMATYLSVVGRRILRSGEYPPPGARVIRDTPILGGSEAESRGRVLQGLSVFLIAIAVAMGTLLWWLASLLASRRG